jgi:hypothetical protein
LAMFKAIESHVTHQTGVTSPSPPISSCATSHRPFDVDRVSDEQHDRD